MKSRFIDTGFNDPYMNMAIDEALLSSELPVLRFYRWAPPGLSIGYFQSVNCFNFQNIKINGIKLVRRLTGGNAVLHDNELTYSFIINEQEMPNSIIESYKIISKGLFQGLVNLGLKPQMNENITASDKSAVCFHDPSWYEILVNNKKIIGSAQKRLNGKLLQHGAILIDADIEKYCSLFNNYSLELVQKLKARMTSINHELSEKIEYDAVKQAVKMGFKDSLNLDFTVDSLSVTEQESAKKLYKEKYSLDKWNLKR
ncbi:MAG: biotin/lipoate A/B protein ligase family protein [Nanoarchaeota archaeon]